MKAKKIKHLIKKTLTELEQDSSHQLTDSLLKIFQFANQVSVETEPSVLQKEKH